MILDVRTMGIVSAITPIVLGFVILVYLRERKVYDGFRRWLLANFGLGVGYLLVTLRDLIPDFFSIVLGNVIVVYCAILIHEGIRRFYGNPSYDRLNYLVLGVYILLQTGFTYVLPNINARVALSGLTVFFLLLRSAKSLFQGTIPGLSKISRSAGYAFLVTSLFPFTRAVFALLQPEPIDFFSDVMNSWFSVIFIVAIVVWTFYFFSRTLNVRLSVGVATVGNDDVNLGMVLRRGDKALYTAKRHGRNQIFSA